MFTLGRATGDGGAELRRAGLPTSRQPAGPFSGLGGTRLAALSAPAARLRLPADGQQVASVPSHRSRPTRLLHRLQRDSGSNQGKYSIHIFRACGRLGDHPKRERNLFELEGGQTEGFKGVEKA